MVVAVPIQRRGVEPAPVRHAGPVQQEQRHRPSPGAPASLPLGEEPFGHRPVVFRRAGAPRGVSPARGPRAALPRLLPRPLADLGPIHPRAEPPDRGRAETPDDQPVLGSNAQLNKRDPR